MRYPCRGRERERESDRERENERESERERERERGRLLLPTRKTVWSDTMRAPPATYRATSPIRNSAPLGPYSRTMQRALWKPLDGGLFLMSEVPL